MWPALRAHDLIEVAEAGERGVRRGDVAVFRVAERPGIVVHRVLWTRRDGLVTRGRTSHSSRSRALSPRVVVFGAAGAAVPRVLVGRRMIGEWDPRTRAWTIRRPYRPLIDEAALPRPENGDA